MQSYLIFFQSAASLDLFRPGSFDLPIWLTKVDLVVQEVDIKKGSLSIPACGPDAVPLLSTPEDIR